jgi:two-component system, chemotaxis family, protein-glutamate methylesterase/glutaminase
MPTPEEDLQRLMAVDVAAQVSGARRSGQTSVYVCPECGGVLWQVDQPERINFQCQVGHSYSAQTLLDVKSQILEATLWAAVRTLAEKETLTHQVSAKFLAEGDEKARGRVEEMARLDREGVRLLRELLQSDLRPTAQAYIVAEALNGASDD